MVTLGRCGLNRFIRYSCSQRLFEEMKLNFEKEKETIIAKLKEMALLLPVGSSAKFDLYVSKSLTYFKGLKLKMRLKTFLLASKAEPKSPHSLTDNPPPLQFRKKGKKKKDLPTVFLRFLTSSFPASIVLESVLEC